MKSKMLGALALFTLIGALFVMQSAAISPPTADAATGTIHALNVGTCLTTDLATFEDEMCKLRVAGLREKARSSSLGSPRGGRGGLDALRHLRFRPEDCIERAAGDRAGRRPDQDQHFRLRTRQADGGFDSGFFDISSIAGIDAMRMMIPLGDYLGEVIREH